MSDRTTVSDFDSGRAAAFAERLLGAINNASLCLMVSVGHRTGLFDTMSRLPGPRRTRLRGLRTSTNAMCASGSARS